MKIEFENGSSIEDIPTKDENIRSKRGEEFIKYLKEHPDFYIELVAGFKLKWYQRLLIKYWYNKKERRNK